MAVNSVATCGEAETAVSIMERMTTGKFRHIPVIERDQLVGIVSIGDIVARSAGAPSQWQGAYDQDGPTAVATRRKLIDRVIANKMMICGAHFPFPGAGVFAKDGDAYTFTPVVQS